MNCFVLLKGNNVEEEWVIRGTRLVGGSVCPPPPGGLGGEEEGGGGGGAL